MPRLTIKVHPSVVGVGTAERKCPAEYALGDGLVYGTKYAETVVLKKAAAKDLEVIVIFILRGN